jgi:hypothetical protein
LRNLLLLLLLDGVAGNGVFLWLFKPHRLRRGGCCMRIVLLLLLLLLLLLEHSLLLLLLLLPLSDLPLLEA